MTAQTLRRDVPGAGPTQLTHKRCACCGAMALHTIRGFMPACVICKDMDKVLAGFDPFRLEGYVRALFGG